MTEGSVTIKMNKEMLENLILPKNEVKNIAHGIVLLNKWAVPHWDLVDKALIGSVQVNVATVGFILDRLRELFPDNTQEVMMEWLDYGWQIKNDLEDWRCRIDFSRINYKE